jgi:hypothetical protein
VIQLEIIHVRSTDPGSPDLLAVVRDALPGAGGGTRFETFRHATLDGDLGIHLRTEVGHGEAGATDLGTRLTDSLRQHGMVEHTVWIEKERDDA